MLNTSLLPREEKKLVKIEETFRLVRFLVSMLVAIFTIGTALLIPSFLPFRLERAGLAEILKLGEEPSPDMDIRKVAEEAKNVKSIIAMLQVFARTSVGEYDIFTQIFSSRKGGVEITMLTVKKDGSTSINGVAASRQDLLSFEKELRDSGKFQEIVSPLSNIIREENINFIMQGKLKQVYSL